MLIRNSAIYVVAKIVPGLLGMATTAILTRVLTPDAYGLYALALLLMNFGAGLAFDWLGLAYLRVAKNPSGVVTGTFVQIFLVLVAATASLALMALSAGLIDDDRAGILGAGLVMAWAYGWFELVARFEVAALRPGAYLRMNLRRAVLMLLGTGGVALLTRDATATAYGTAAALLLSGGLKRYRLGRAGFDKALGRAALIFGLPLAASLVLTTLTGSLTRAMVDWLGSIEALGLYTAGFVLIQNTLAVAAAGIAAAGFSLAVRAVDSGDREVAARQLEANATLLLAVLAPASLGMALTAKGIAALLVGPHYVATVTALTPWMAAGALLAGFRAHYLDHAFQLGHRPAAQLWVAATGCASTLLLALLLIPERGPVGAAMAVTAGAAVSLLHAMLAGRRAYPLPLPWAGLGRIAASCLAMAAIVTLCTPAGLVVQIVAGAATYAASAVALDLLGLRGKLLARRTRPQAA